MAEVIAFDDVKPTRRQLLSREGKPYWRTEFVVPQREDEPQAFLIEVSPQANVFPHFHVADQYQVIVGGDGSLGHHALQQLSVHYANAYTTYGPILARDQGLAWMTLRPRRDAGALAIEDHRDLLTRDRDRPAWQTTVDPDFRGLDAGGCTGFLEAGNGLGGKALVLAPGASVLADEPSTTSCQFILVTGGSLLHEGQRKQALTLVCVRPHEGAYRLQAGPDGLRCLVLHFARESAPAHAPQTQPAATAHAGDTAADWHCELCGFVYEESKGLPEAGIAPGTPWSSLPEDFKCPDCAATKPDFVPLGF